MLAEGSVLDGCFFVRCGIYPHPWTEIPRTMGIGSTALVGEHPQLRKHSFPFMLTRILYTGGHTG